MPSSSFTVTISSINKSSPSDGFIDPFRNEYYRSQPNAPKGTDMATMATKKKGFVRWHRLENQLMRLGNVYISNITAPGSDMNTVPTSVSFTATAEHGAASLFTNDELNAGVQLAGIDTIKRAIARALISSLNANQEVWDPTTVASTDVIRFGYRTIPLDVGALCADLAEANGFITVTAI